ncbi:hypothetical protein BU16DRAFT_527125 [Lophium mytilinum]|uniref:Uncharacterized protein n=1 Tax=Lophium mytilinum TaxID=390894 RepID=A0A6A6QRV6_9PEZI|nr:hypothetical protein BU16DRAFT_527125 [Lophium mytilinum]
MANSHHIHQHYGTILLESPRDRRRRSREESPAYQCFGFLMFCAVAGFMLFVLFQISSEPQPGFPNGPW